MDINGISNNFLNSITDNTVAQEKAEQAKFDELLKKAQNTDKAAEDAELLEACGEFESYFLNRVFKEMRESIPEGGLVEKDGGMDYYEDMLYDAYTKEMSQGRGTGIKEMLFRQLKKEQS